MNLLIRVARTAYGIMAAGLGAQQMIYAKFRGEIFPPWHIAFPVYAVCVYLISAIFVAGSIAIILNKKAKTAALILGGLFLLLFLFGQIPYELIADPSHKHLFAWAPAVQELVLIGGGFVVAGSLPQSRESAAKALFIINLLHKLIPYGSVIFCLNIIIYGIEHFMYTQNISALVPGWISNHIFWTYFAGAALVTAGIAIILKIKLRLSALLLSLMIFLWLLTIHIPRAIADPHSYQGNEISSALEAFGCSGIAYLIAYGYGVRKTAVKSKSIG